MWGVFAYVFAGMRFAVAGALIATLVGAVVFSASAPIDDTGREKIGSRGPYAVLLGSIRSGCIQFILYVSLFVLAKFFVLDPLTHGPVETNTGLWLLLIVTIGLVAGLNGGWSAVVWHFLLRLQLARERALPWRLVDFLQWTSLPEREWTINIGGSFRFRHREFQAFLAALKQNSTTRQESAP
jgi:hypothetical protein